MSRPQRLSRLPGTRAAQAERLGLQCHRLAAGGDSAGGNLVTAAFDDLCAATRRLLNGG